ncbi:MAG: radical SAM protein [Clostridia bacterium]|nr:radical SAM protein [Clostridia bacterium]
MIAVTKKERLQRAAASVALDGLYAYIRKAPAARLVQLIDLAQKLSGSTFPAKNFDSFRRALKDPENVWRDFAERIVRESDPGYIKKLFLALGLGAGVNGTKAVRANREKYHCNIPFLLLMDPTSACNMHCKGCWSAEYGHRLNLTLDEMRSIVDQGTALGTHVYMLTGGEPLVRKDDILTLCAEHPDCAFLAYTNATLVDQSFCSRMKAVGNLTLAISIEGTQESTDDRRGEGAYQRAIKAMELLQRNGIFYGVSICYTSKNTADVTDDAFLRLLVEKGARFAFYFNYMPVGSAALPALIPTPEQRVYMYKWLRKVRSGKTGHPIFVMDFQNDGEYVGGCIAAGRNYFHINSAGDMEPCVFVHYSDANIRTHTLLEGLKNPLFQAYYHNQPFNDNHLRPCPLLENPEYLRAMVAQTGAKSTDLIEPESVETLCGRCDAFAKAWQPVADQLWQSTPHPDPKTQFYRDTPEGKAARKD